MKNSNILILAWLGMALVIIILSLLPTISFSNEYNVDKIAHFTGYFIISITSTILFKLKKKVFIAVLFLVFLAMCTEIIQIYIPNRTASYGDTAANILGIIIGTFAGYLFARLRK